MKPYLKLYFLCGALFLSACGTDDDTTGIAPINSTIVGVAVGTTSDYTTASHSLIATELPYNAHTELAPDDNTDIDISQYGNFFYKINRGGDSIIKFDVANSEEPIWECSTGADSNPYQLIQISDSKAYVLRYGAGEVWVVNPSIDSSSKCATSFKTGEIDLSSFDTIDNIPNMAQGVVVGDYMFVIMQRLTPKWSPEGPGLIAVIDITTDTLVDADDTISGTQAITLVGKNPQSIQFFNNKLYVQSVGEYYSSVYEGGIDTIDPTDFTVTQLVDDTLNTTKQISGMVIISNTVGYLISYEGWKVNTLYQFNPTTGDIEMDGGTSPAPIASLSSQNISGIYAGPNNSLWVGGDSGFTILDTSDNSVIQTLIDTKMNPTGLVFIDRS